MKGAEKTIRTIDKISSAIGEFASWMTFLLVLLICLDVSARKLFNFSSVAIFELEWHLFAIVFLFGAAMTLGKDKHVRVDMFYSRFSPKAKAWVDFLGFFLFLLPFCLVVLNGAWKYVELSIALNESSTDPGGLPARYVTKSFMIVGFAFLLLQGIGQMLKSWLVIIGKPTNPN